MSERKYIKKAHGMIPLIGNLPATDFLEQMAGANKWHSVAREVFIESFLKEDHSGSNFALIDNQDLAETLLHEGRQIVESDRELGYLNEGSYKKLAVDLYKEYKKRVHQVGHGDVSEYAKKTSGKSRKDLWGF